jgi:hypothetical protein
MNHPKHHLLVLLVRAARCIARHLAAALAAHWRLLRDNPAYAATVGVAAAAIVTQLGWRDLLAVLLSAAVAIWSAIRGASSDQAPQRVWP